MTRVNNWLQMLGNLGLIVGLVFVGLQLQQDRELKRIEMVSRVWTDLFEREMAALGDEPYRAIVKAAVAPDALTEEETYVYQTYLSLVLTGWDRRQAMEAFGLFDSGWQAHTGIPLEFMTPAGARYLTERLSRGNYPNALAERLLAEVRKPDFTTRLATHLRGLTAPED